MTIGPTTHGYGGKPKVPSKLNLRDTQLPKMDNELLRTHIRHTLMDNSYIEGYVQTRFAGWIRQVFVNQTYQSAIPPLCMMVFRHSLKHR